MRCNCKKCLVNLGVLVVKNHVSSFKVWSEITTYYSLNTDSLYLVAGSLGNTSNQHSYLNRIVLKT